MTDEQREQIRVLQVLVALAHGELSEGQAAKLLVMDRVTVREKLDAASAAGCAQWDEFRGEG